MKFFIPLSFVFAYVVDKLHMPFLIGTLKKWRTASKPIGTKVPTQHAQYYKTSEKLYAHWGSVFGSWWMSVLVWRDSFNFLYCGVWKRQED